MRAPFSRTISELLLEQAQRAPEAALAIGAKESVSYHAMAERMRSVAGGLARAGIRRGSRVGLLATNRIEWLEVFFGAAALGATIVPFSTWSTAHELAYLLEDSKTDILFTLAHAGDRDFAADLEALRAARAPGLPGQIVLMDADRRDGFRPYSEIARGDPVGALPPGAGPSAADVLVILYTSGSSSRPKSVPLLQHGIIENGFNIGERQGLAPGDRVLVAVPLFWSYGVANALPAILTHRATVVLQERFAAGGALELIERHGCTALYTLPAMTNALVAHPTFAPERTRTLRTGVTIGSPQDVLKAAELLGARDICNIYGSTETYGNCCVTPHTWPLEERAVSQGPPLPGVSIRIRHAETGELLAAGEIGEVEVKGYLTPGYSGASSVHNAQVFTSDGFFRTGDLGSLDPAGRFRYAGRSSEMIKRSGINVSPAEVEEVLQQHPDVGLAGVTGIPDDVRGEIIVAFVVARPGATVDPQTLAQHCRAKLSRYKVPDRIELRDALPLTPTGKLMRRELKAIAEASQA
jgi:fatty-acyl-CoA synthase